MPELRDRFPGDTTPAEIAEAVQLLAGHVSAGEWAVAGELASWIAVATDWQAREDQNPPYDLPHGADSWADWQGA